MNQPAGERTRGPTKHSRTHLVFEAWQASIFNFTKTKENSTFTAKRPKKNLPHPHGSGPLPDETERHRNDGGSDEHAGEEIDPPYY